MRLKTHQRLFPGVGHFEKGMKNLKELDLVTLLNDKVLDEKTPVLGICLGMQLLTRNSEEGNCEGLGWIDGETKAFRDSLPETYNYLKIPHMGWNHIQAKTNNPLLVNHYFSLPFFFVHSYFVTCSIDNESSATTNYGIEFTSVVNKDNIFGTQFHPEKSHKQGLNLLKNFAGLR